MVFLTLVQPQNPFPLNTHECLEDLIFCEILWQTLTYRASKYLKCHYFAKQNFILVLETLKFKTIWRMGESNVFKPNEHLTKPGDGSFNVEGKFSINMCLQVEKRTRSANVPPPAPGAKAGLGQARPWRWHSSGSQQDLLSSLWRKAGLGATQTAAAGRPSL